MRVLVAGLGLAAMLLPTNAFAQGQRPGRPNIIFIKTDDHAAHAIGAYGSKVNQTPHLDRLAREGALLTSVFATNAICTPSRAAILTFFLMMHHKAPHRPWEPSAEHAARFAAQRIPEPATFWDDYETRTDARHENQQRVASDLTNRDLKLMPPSGLSAEELAKWRVTKPNSVTIERDGKRVTLTGEVLVRWKYQRYMQDYLATVQPVDDSVGSSCSDFR